MTEKTQTDWRERLGSPLTWHWFGFGLLLILVVVLGTRLALDWRATSAGSMEAMHTRQVQLKTLELQTAPLRGLDKRVDKTREQIKTFYDTRIPANYSQIAAQLGDIAVKSGVRLTRAQYAQRPPENNLTEIAIDAGVSGQYFQIMHFVNSLERDKTFFVIRGMNLTGQQGGLVNLRLQLSTWLRPADAAASGLPQQAENNTGREEQP
jgi:type IV pilus assembly protein PilO